MTPQRIQRQRTRGWRTPECSCGQGHPAIYVGRPGKYGNPYRVIRETHPEAPGPWAVTVPGGEVYLSTKAEAATGAADLYRRVILPLLDLEPLRGHDLMCWCRPGQSCHADLLLTIANQETA